MPGRLPTHLRARAPWVFFSWCTPIDSVAGTGCCCARHIWHGMGGWDDGRGRLGRLPTSRHGTCVHSLTLDATAGFDARDERFLVSTPTDKCPSASSDARWHDGASNGPNNGASEPATDLHGQRRPAAVIGSRTHGGAVQLSPNLMPELAELAALAALAGLLSSTHTRGPSRMPLALL